MADGKAQKTTIQQSSVDVTGTKDQVQRSREAGTSTYGAKSVSGFKNTITIGIEGIEIQGFLSEEGLNIGLQNNWGKLFGDGNLFAALSKTMSQIGAAYNFKQSVAANIKDLGKTIGAAAGIGSGSLGQSGGALVANVVTNSPMFWTGTEPLELNITFYQIAEFSGEIMNSYRNLLYAAAPRLDDPTGIVTKATKTADSFISVYGLYFTDLVVNNITCKVKGPFDNVMSPAIGEYNIMAKTQKMIDKNRLLEIFKTTPIGVAEDTALSILSGAGSVF